MTDDGSLPKRKLVVSFSITFCAATQTWRLRRRTEAALQEVREWLDEKKAVGGEEGEAFAYTFEGVLYTFEGVLGPRDKCDGKEQGPGFWGCPLHPRQKLRASAQAAWGAVPGEGPQPPPASGGFRSGGGIAARGRPMQL